MEFSASKVRVIDKKFCYSDAENMLVTPEKGSFKKTGPLNVYNADGILLFKVIKGDSLLLSTDRLILDGADTPVALLRRKRFSFDNGWKVYKGKHGTKEAALFKVRERKKSDILDVYVPSNDPAGGKKEKTGKFYVVGRFLPTFYTSFFTVASAKKKSRDDDGEFLELEIDGGIDCAFILALLVIHGEIRHWKMDQPKVPLAPPSSNEETVVGGGRQRVQGSNASVLGSHGGGGAGGYGGGGCAGAGGCSSDA